MHFEFLLSPQKFWQFLSDSFHTLKTKNLQEIGRICKVQKRIFDAFLIKLKCLVFGDMEVKIEWILNYFRQKLAQKSLKIPIKLKVQYAQKVQKYVVF